MITGYKIVSTNEAPLKDTNTPWDKAASSVYFAKKKTRLGTKRRTQHNWAVVNMRSREPQVARARARRPRRRRRHEFGYYLYNLLSSLRIFREKDRLLAVYPWC